MNFKKLPRVAFIVSLLAFALLTIHYYFLWLPLQLGSSSFCDFAYYICYSIISFEVFL